MPTDYAALLVRMDYLLAYKSAQHDTIADLLRDARTALRELQTALADAQLSAMRDFSFEQHKREEAEARAERAEAQLDASHKETGAEWVRAEQPKAQLATLREQNEQLSRSIADLNEEYHAALNEPSYAGTRYDWIQRAQVAEARAAEAETQLGRAKTLVVQLTKELYF